MIGPKYKPRPGRASGEDYRIGRQSNFNSLAEMQDIGYWEDYTADLGAAKPSASSPPTYTQFRDDGAGSTGVFAWAFSASTTNDMFITFHVKHDYKPNTPFYIHVHWSPGSSTNTGTVRWGVEYTIAKGHNQEAFPTTSTVYIEQAAPGTAYQHMIAEVADVDAISSTSLETDAIMICRIFRDGGHANDTFTAVAYGFQVDIHYQKDRLGTALKVPPFSLE